MKLDRVWCVAQVLAACVIVLAIADVAFADDGCSQEIRRDAGGGPTWLNTSCNTGTTCNAPAQCVAQGVDDFTICVCPEGGPHSFGFLCKPGYMITGGTVNRNGEAKPLVAAICVNWTCPNPCPTDEDNWESLGSSGQEKLVCSCE